MKEHGYKENEICVVTDIPDYTVRRIIQDEDINKTIIRENWQNKIPVMQDIVSMGMDALREAFKELADPAVRKAMIAEIKDMAALTKIITDMNMLLRLEEGKSTSNVEVHKKSFQDTLVVLQNLAKVDPVFSYQIGDGSSEGSDEPADK